MFDTVSTCPRLGKFIKGFQSVVVALLQMTSLVVVPGGGSREEKFTSQDPKLEIQDQVGSAGLTQGQH